MMKNVKLTKNGKIVFIAIALIVVVLMGCSIYFNDKFYPNTYIGDIDVSGMTKKEAKSYIQQYLDDYMMEITGRNEATFSIKGRDIGLSVDYNDIVGDCFDQEHRGISFMKILTHTNYENNFKTQYNKEQLKGLIDSSYLIIGNDHYSIQKPVNSYVKYNDKLKSGKIVKEKQGNQIDVERLYQVLDNEIKDLAKSVDLDQQDVYMKPTITSHSDLIEKQLQTYNQYLLNWIKWDMGKDHYETITPQDIKEWIVINQDGSVDIDKEKLSNWIETFCKKYKTVGITRSFKSHTGATIQVSGGDYGWQLNYDQTLEDAYQAIKANTKQSLIDAYIKNPTKTNKKALTVELEPVYKNKGAKMDYDHPENDWDTSSYSEVDIAEQMVYVFKNGEVVYSAKCVTGLPSDPKRATRLGCWYIKDKKEDYVLVGDDYKTPTKYWIRITWTGIGYHYMNRSDWQNWSPEIYKTRGSHGCINLQMEDVKNIYNLVKMRDMVFIH